MIKKVDHFVITTANIDDCLTFYEKLGFQRRGDIGRYQLFAGDFKINVHILGHELSPHAGHVQIGSADLCFEITEPLESFEEALAEKGLETLSGIVPRTGAFGEMRSVYLRDPDGNLLEFCNYQT